MDSFTVLYAQRLGLQQEDFTRINHEDAMVAIAYKVTPIIGVPLILKICERENDYLRELFFLNYFAGSLPVARIVQVIQPEKEVHGAILMECLPGTLLTQAELNDSLACEIGRVLASIHCNRTTGYGDLIQPDELSLDPRSYFTMKFEEGMDECKSHLPEDWTEKICLYFYTHVDLLTHVDGPCIVHRDFRPGNLMVCEGKLQGVIDWAGARASFAEEDFSSLEHGEWMNNPGFKNAFLEGYASIRPVPDYKKLMILLRLSRAIATIGFTVKRGTWQGEHARIYQFNRRFLEITLINPVR